MFIIHKKNLHYGGFAGLKEHRIVMDVSIFGRHKNRGTADGLGSLLYLADAQFNPYGETHMHPHHEVDVISVMIEGQVNHEGSLEHGNVIRAGEVQVQRAGGEGFTHNEINPENRQNRMIQLWFAPQIRGERAGYQHFDKTDAKVLRVYGGEDEDTFKSNTIMEVLQLKAGERFLYEGECQGYVTKGVLSADNQSLENGDLFSSDTLEIEAKEDSQFIFIHLLSQRAV